MGGDDASCEATEATAAATAKATAATTGPGVKRAPPMPPRGRLRAARKAR